ncbi:hypothetical protein [Methylocella sp.]|jgi:hypothetical protein|uniref:hypothetical protein n=1 Tax=Methylocella sp. TaxID=1978226 RepID=UPI003C2338F1
MKRLLSLALVAFLALPAHAETDFKTLSCGSIVGNGWDKMPDVVDYILSQKNGDKLGFASECHLGALVFSQCWLEPKITVGQAIELLINKATSHRKLPDTPVCGA